MPSTDVYSLRFPSLTDLANGPEAFQNLADDTEAALVQHAVDIAENGPDPVVTELPVSPEDGQRCVYMADSQTFWQLQYYAAGTCWFYKGGIPLVDADADSGTKAGTAYGNLSGDTPNGPTVTVPSDLTGTWDVTTQARIQSSASGTLARASFEIGGANADDLDGLISDAANGGVNQRTQRMQLTAGDVLVMKYRNGDAGTATFGRRRLEITPVVIDPA